MQMEERRKLIHWGPLVCSCRRRFDWNFEDTAPPQADCAVHGVLTFNPLTGEDLALFQAVLTGEHALNGFRNADLAAWLYPDVATSAEEARRRTQRVCRLIAKLRGHGLIMKVKDARLYGP